MLYRREIQCIALVTQCYIFTAVLSIAIFIYWEGLQFYQNSEHMYLKMAAETVSKYIWLLHIFFSFKSKESQKYCVRTYSKCHGNSLPWSNLCATISSNFFFFKGADGNVFIYFFFYFFFHTIFTCSFPFAFLLPYWCGLACRLHSVHTCRDPLF